MKVYIDTCVFSRLLDLNIEDEELDALNSISDNDSIDFITSEKTLEEFLNTKDDKRRKSLKVLFRLITKVKNIQTTYQQPALWGTVMWGEATFGGSVTRVKPDFKKIRDIFDEDDSVHIFQAIKNNCDYFLTLDRRTILSRVEANKESISQLSNIRFVSPSQLNETLDVS